LEIGKIYLQPEHKDYWTLDIETDDLDATRIWVCCVHNIFSGLSKTFTNREDFLAFHRDNRKYITHNGISFDIPVINRLWGARIHLRNVIDTLVLSFLYNPRLPRPHNYPGRKGPHSLEVWGFRLGNNKIQFDDWSALTSQMITYCKQDAALTSDLYKALTARMRQLGYTEKSAEIEHRFRHIIDKQQQNGFKFDKTRANFLYLKLRELQYACERQLHIHFPPELVVDKVYDYRVKKDGEPVASFLRHQSVSPKLEFNKDRTRYRTFKYQTFNIGSPKQRTDRLLKLGWKPKNFTPKGNPKVDEESVLEFAKIKPEVAPIADWLVYNGRANMIRTWLENLDEDSCIRGKVLSCGAGSRRCTHNSPNTANIPSVYARYGADARSLWVSRPKRLLLGADASGLEGRVFIHYLGSKEAEEFMLNDPHTANAEAISRAVGFTVERAPTKNLFYARLYGASDKKLGSMVGKGPKVGAIIRAAIDGNIPGFEDLVAAVEREYENNNGRIKTIDGGYVTAPSPHSALNYKFQSCGAIIMKQAAIFLDDMLREENLDALKVSDVHDEWEYDCLPEHAERVGQLACKAMTMAGEELKLNIKIEGEYMIGKTWADVH
jgi:DNA polymerase I-like protein with 3'-5' exonuclease and polymerase domains